MSAAVRAAPPWGSGGGERRLPDWMDPNGNQGELVILLMVPKDGQKFPDNPFIVGRSLEQAIGGKLDDSYTDNKGTRYILKVRSEAKAKKLLAMKKLIDGTDVEVQSHPTLNLVKCVVNCPEAVNMSEELLQEELSSQGVTKVHRILRRVNNDKVNTPTLILTVSGTVVPRHIWFGSLRIATRVYFPSPMMCYKCFAYGHTKMRCQGQERCQNCSKTHQIDENGCPNPAKCLHCDESHPTTSKKCKVYLKEEEIIRIKVNTGVSFVEAKKEYERCHGSQSYAGVSGVQDRLKQDEKDREIQLLRSEIAKLRKTVEELSKKKRSKKDRKIVILKGSDSEMDGEETDKTAKRKQQSGSGDVSPPHKRSVNDDSEMMSGSNYESAGAVGGEKMASRGDPKMMSRGTFGGSKYESAGAVGGEKVASRGDPKKMSRGAFGGASSSHRRN